MRLMLLIGCLVGVACSTWHADLVGARIGRSYGVVRQELIRSHFEPVLIQHADSPLSPVAEELRNICGFEEFWSCSGLGHEALCAVEWISPARDHIQVQTRGVIDSENCDGSPTVEDGS